MKKNLWMVLFAFLFGQMVQLVTNALAHYLYVSDPVMLCVTIAIVTVALVVMTAVFTLMDNKEQPINGLHQAKPGRTDPTIVKPIFSKNWRPPLDTNQEDIDEIDKNNAQTP